jgi:periplasmic protein TonB
MPSPNSFAALRRVPTPLVLVGGLHLAVIWALLNGLQIHNAASRSPTDIVVDFIDKPVPPLDAPPPQQFRPDEIKFTEPQPPPFVVDVSQVAPSVIFEDLPPLRAEPQNLGGSADPRPVITAAAVDRSHPLTQPPYPMSSRRLGESGSLALDILIGADGRVRDAKVSQSSGYERLDQAAVSEAKQHWHLRPATRNGVPFEQWLTLKVVFRFEDAGAGQ